MNAGVSSAAMAPEPHHNSNQTGAQSSSQQPSAADAAARTSSKRHREVMSGAPSSQSSVTNSGCDNYLQRQWRRRRKIDTCIQPAGALSPLLLLLLLLLHTCPAHGAKIYLPEGGRECIAQNLAPEMFEVGCPETHLPLHLCTVLRASSKQTLQMSFQIFQMIQFTYHHALHSRLKKVGPI